MSTPSEKIYVLSTRTFTREQLDSLRSISPRLDVFDREPLPAESPLWRLDNVILSPHIAGITPRDDEHVLKIFAENLRRYVDGRPLLNLVDRTKGY